MEESVVNLMFLNTFMVDKISSDKWETFINAKGPQLETMSTQQLYAEVRVNAGRIKPVEPVPNEVKLSKRSRPRFNNLSNPSPLDLTISNETMTTAKDDEEVTEATLATMVETRVGNEPSRSEPGVSSVRTSRVEMLLGKACRSPSRADLSLGSGLTRLGKARTARSQLGNYIM